MECFVIFVMAWCWCNATESKPRNVTTYLLSTMFQNFFITKKLKKISIRGRFAFGVKCIEQYAFEKNIDNKWIYKILETLWEFTNTDRLDIWDEKIEDLNPWNILEEHPDNNPSDYKTLSINEFNELYIFYNSLDKNFIDMIGNVIEIGTGNLYGATGKFSLFSLKPTLEVLRIAKLEIKQIPDIKFFEFSKFSEENGWGNNFSKDKLKNML